MIPTGMGHSSETRLLILRAAERLFAERGVDAVSLREINAAAGQRNKSAAHYYFKDREGLIDALLERHSDPINPIYDLAMDRLIAEGRVSLRALVEIVVAPLVAKVDDPDGGVDYLRIAAQLAVSPTMPLIARPAATKPAARRVSLAMMPFYGGSLELFVFRMERFAVVLYSSIASWARIVGGGGGPVPREAFIADLVDTLCAVVAQPPSSETTAALLRPRG